MSGRKSKRGRKHTSSPWRLIAVVIVLIAGIAFLRDAGTDMLYEMPLPDTFSRALDALLHPESFLDL